MVHFTKAGPGEVLRAAQKDEIWCDRIQKSWWDIILKIGGTRQWLKVKNIPVGQLIYNSATTLCGLQTLGEEYTGIVQVDPTGIRVPSFTRRLIMVVLNSFGHVFIEHFLKRFEMYIRNNHYIRPEAKTEILSKVKTLRSILSFIEKVHKAVFYSQGLFYQISKRTTGVHYVLIRKWLKDYESLYGFKVLGSITFLHLLGLSISTTYKWWKTVDGPKDGNIVQETSSSPSPVSHLKKCPLCLEQRKNVSVTPCGHLFCWTCITEWLQVQNQCPICREVVQPSRVVPLRNYQ